MIIRLELTFDELEELIERYSFPEETTHCWTCFENVHNRKPQDNYRRDWAIWPECECGRKLFNRLIELRNRQSC